MHQTHDKIVMGESHDNLLFEWDTPAEVRRSLVHVNNWVVNGEITAKEANAVFYSANLILKALEQEKQ